MPNSSQEAGCSYTVPTLPHKRSTYDDIVTENTEDNASDSLVTQAEEIEPDEDETSTAGDPQTAEGTVTETNTPLPTTPIRCSSSYGPRSVQLDREQMTTLIRATVTAEGTTGIHLEPVKNELEGLNEKK